MPAPFRIVRVDFWEFFQFLAQESLPLDLAYDYDTRQRFVLVGDVLFIGNIDDVVLLHILGTKGMTFDLVYWFRNHFTCDDIASWERDEMNRRVTGAGSTNPRGEVIAWRSRDLDVTTPPILRPSIQQAISEALREPAPQY